MLLWKFSYLKVEVWFFNDCGGQSTLSDDNPGKLLLSFSSTGVLQTTWRTFTTSHAEVSPGKNKFLLTGRTFTSNLQECIRKLDVSLLFFVGKFLLQNFFLNA